MKLLLVLPLAIFLCNSFSLDKFAHGQSNFDSQLSNQSFVRSVFDWFNGGSQRKIATSPQVIFKSNELNQNGLTHNRNKTWISRLQNVFESLAKDLEENLTKDREDGVSTTTPASVVSNDGQAKPTLADEEGAEENVPEMELERCEMLNGTLGYCQPTQHCVMQEPEQKKFTVCKWSEGVLTRSPPEKLCCPKVQMSIDELKQQFELWVVQSKLEMFASGLPKQPDGRCGVSALEKENQLRRETMNDTDKKSTGKQEDEYLRRNPNLNKVRIVLGRSVRIGQIPWMVAIYYREQFICGGSLISDRHVLTAAHCFSTGRNPKDYSVRYESVLMFNGTRNQVDNFVIHEDYSPPAIYNDIALMTLSRPVQFNQFIQPVCLPGKRMYNELMIGNTGMVSGFGDLAFGGSQATILQEVDVQIINNTFCDRNYRRLIEGGRKFRHGIGKSLICAGYKDGGKDACQGDSGGPLTLNYKGANYLIGVVSFGYRCALPKFPGVYTCVAHYLKWIFEHLQI